MLHNSYNNGVGSACFYSSITFLNFLYLTNRFFKGVVAVLVTYIISFLLNKTLRSFKIHGTIGKFLKVDFCWKNKFKIWKPSIIIKKNKIVIQEPR